MVFEALTSPMAAEERPWQMFLLGILYSSLGVILGLWIFRDYASLIMVFITVMGCLPIVYNTVKLEEKKDEQEYGESRLLLEHAKALKVFMYLFLGITFSLALWYAFLPQDLIGPLFSAQTVTIQMINPPTARVSFFGTFTEIFFNNFKVMLFCLLFSFLYGFGAIFILVWNASVIAVAIGIFFRINLESAVAHAGMAKAACYFQVFPLGLTRYVIHGIPEILAFFVAALAGGIISAAVVRHTFGTKKFESVVIDTGDLIMIALGLLLLAAFLEVYVTPGLFQNLSFNQVLSACRA
jgi:uncharacterized membrane protein SpoIIM required for sporulation